MGDSDIIEKARETISKPFLFIDPNTITYSSIFFALIASILFFYSYYILSIIFIALSFLADAIDGFIARKTKKVSNYGAFIDGIADRIVEFLFIFTLMLKFPNFFPQLVIFLSFGTFMHSYVRAYATHRHLLKESDVYEIDTFLSRKKRVIAIILMAISLSFNIYAYEISWLFALLSLIAFVELMFKMVGKWKQSKNQRRKIK